MELVVPIETMFTNVRAIAGIKIVIIIHFIPFKMFQHTKCIPLKLNFISIFQNIRHELFDLLKDGGWRLSFVLGAEELISEPLFWILQLLQFGISILSLQLFWYFVFSSVSAIWYLRSVSATFFWSDILSSASAKSDISTFLQLLQFGIFVLSLQLFWYFVRLLFSFCNLIFAFNFCNSFLEWYFVFRFCKIWYFDFPSAFAIWYFYSVFAIVLVFRLLFSFCNFFLEWYFVFRFCKIWYFDFP